MTLGCEVSCHPSHASDENIKISLQITKFGSHEYSLIYIYLFQYLFSNFIKLYFPLFGSFCKSTNVRCQKTCIAELVILSYLATNNHPHRQQCFPAHNKTSFWVDGMHTEV